MYAMSSVRSVEYKNKATMLERVDNLFLTEFYSSPKVETMVGLYAHLKSVKF